MIQLNKSAPVAPPEMTAALTQAQRVQRMIEYDPTMTRVTSAYSATIAASALRAYVTQHEPTKEMLKNASLVSAQNIPVTIIGPSGTGKEMIARILHGNRSVSTGRTLDNFRAINCSGIPEALFESILFGHVKGAFTGAIMDTPGLLRSAEHGTAFLDEVGDLPLDQQAKLLRVIQSRKVQPVGSALEFPVSCRFVFATHKNLRGMVDAGQFREDLFYRITPITLRTHALAERPDDAVLIAQSIAQANKWEFPGPIPGKVLSSNGNVRALENWMARCQLLGLEGDSEEALQDL
jgi:transcriptional regulator with PAS, ATPase and Fis domain